VDTIDHIKKIGKVEEIRKIMLDAWHTYKGDKKYIVVYHFTRWSIKGFDVFEEAVNELNRMHSMRWDTLAIVSKEQVWFYGEV